MRQDDLLIYRRRLPHWRLAGSTYFVTWRLASTQSELSPKERDLVVAALRHFEGERYELLAYVVMHDHIHLLATPLETYRLQEIVHSWKSFTANSLQRTSGRRGAVWQDEYYDRIVRDEEELLEKSTTSSLTRRDLGRTSRTTHGLDAYWKAGTEARPTTPSVTLSPIRHSRII